MRIAAACAVVMAACDLYFAPATPDGSACAPDDDPPIVATGDPGAIDVHLDGGGAIVVEDADGTRTMSTDGNGDLTATIRPPAVVTGVSPDRSYFGTITGVEPGDRLCLSCPPPSGPHDPMNDIRSSIAAPAYAGAYLYDFDNGENLDQSGSTSNAIPSYVSGPHDVAAVALDKSLVPLAWAMSAGQTLTDGGVVTLDAWHAPVTFTATYDHLGEPIAQLRIGRAERSSADSLPAFAFSNVEHVELGADTATATTPASDAGSPLMTVISQITSASYDTQGVYETVPASSTYHLDGSQALLRWMSGISYDPCEHVVSWTESAEGLAPDGVWISIGWRSGATLGQWWVLVPPGVTRFRFPTLPPGAPPWAAIDRSQIWAYDVDAVTTYAAMRAWSPAAVTPATRPHRYSTILWSSP